jgi:hypothetical protein
MPIRKQQRKQKGQALILIAGALVALIALVALAVDGGNAYNQRRIAQNAADGATHAAMTKLYDLFMAHRLWGSPPNQHTNCNAQGCVMRPITEDENVQLLQRIQDVLGSSGYGNAANDPNGYGIDTRLVSQGGTLEIYFITSNGTKVTSAQVGSGGANFMDRDNPNGLTGIWIGTTATAPTYFARLIGQNQVRSDAHASGRLQSVVSITDAQQYRIWPIGLDVGALPPPGQQATIFHNGQGQGNGPGNWFQIDFCPGGNCGTCGNQTLADWLQNGFNPGCGLNQAYEVTPLHQPVTDTPSTNGNGSDWHTDPIFPLGNDGSGRAGTTGVWVHGQTGNDLNNACNDTLPQARNEGWDVLIPIYDRTSGGPPPVGLNGATGNNQIYHLIGLARFHITGLPNCGGQNIQIRGTFNGWATSTGANGDPNLIPGITLGNVILQIGP